MDDKLYFNVVVDYTNGERKSCWARWIDIDTFPKDFIEVSNTIMAPLQ